MVEVISEKKQKIDGEHYLVTQELSDGSRRELSQNGDKIFKTNTIQKDGSYIILDGNDVKIEELTSDGYLREYNPQTQKLVEEISPDKVVTRFHENGNISSFLQKITEKSTLRPFVTKALAFGNKLKSEKRNALINHHILKSAWNKFKNPKIEVPKTGVYKLLSKEYRR